MMNTVFKAMAPLCLLLLSNPSPASNQIKVTVKTYEKDAAAIGFTVNGNRIGGLGKAFTGQGPIDKEYVFGYRKKSAFGPDIRCGSLVLNQSSTILLVRQNDVCNALLDGEAHWPEINLFSTISTK